MQKMMGNPFWKMMVESGESEEDFVKLADRMG